LWFVEGRQQSVTEEIRECEVSVGEIDTSVEVFRKVVGVRWKGQYSSDHEMTVKDR
jgi:hypothetical protein